MLPHCEPRQTRLSFCNPVCREFLASLRRMDASWVRCFLRELYGFCVAGMNRPQVFILPSTLIQSILQPRFFDSV